MKATLSLPSVTPFHGSPDRSGDAASAKLPRVQRLLRQGPALHPSPMGGGDDVLSLNLTQGCAQRCSFCLARAFPTYPGDGVVNLFADNVERIGAELAARRQ